MVAGFTLLLAKIAAWAEWFGSLFVAIFVAAWDFVRDAAVWPFEQLMTIVVSAVSAINTAGVSGNLGAWASLTPDVLNVLGLLGCGTAITIISGAIGIRLLLQLIPFVRFGS